MRGELRTLIRLAETARDEAKRTLAARRRKIAELEGRIAALARDLARELDVARTDPLITGASFAAYAEAAAHEQRTLAEALAAAEVEAAAAHDALTQAHRHVRSLELAQAARDHRRAVKAARSEQARLDDLARNRMRRARTASALAGG